jgi:hypothetical protein
MQVDRQRFLALAMGLATSTAAGAAGCIIQQAPPPAAPVANNAAPTTSIEPTDEVVDPFSDPNCWGFNSDGDCVAFISEGMDDPNYRSTEECVRWMEPVEEAGWGPTDECEAWLFEPHTEY